MNIYLIVPPLKALPLASINLIKLLALSTTYSNPIKSFTPFAGVVLSVSIIPTYPKVAGVPVWVIVAFVWHHLNVHSVSLTSVKSLTVLWLVVSLSKLKSNTCVPVLTWFNVPVSTQLSTVKSSLTTAVFRAKSSVSVISPCCAPFTVVLVTTSIPSKNCTSSTVDINVPPKPASLS